MTAIIAKRGIWSLFMVFKVLGESVASMMRPPTVEVSLPLLGKDYGIEREDRFLIEIHLQFTVSFIVVNF